MNKCKECGRDEWGFLSALNEDGYCPTCAIKHNQDKIKRLQELLSQEEYRIRSLLERVGEADKIIKYYAEKQGKLKACDYLNKWGVK